MDENQFAQETSFVLQHLFHYLHTKGWINLFLNVPKDFQNSELKKKLSDYIYNMYSFDFSFQHLVDNPIDQKPNINLTKELQTFASQLLQITTICDKNFRHPPFIQPYTDSQGWFYAGKLRPEQASHRIYVNVNINYMYSFLIEFLTFLANNEDIQLTFKIASPFSITAEDLMRPEKIVIYNSSTSNYQKLIQFLESHNAKFSEHTSLFTTKVTRGVSLAPHLSPEKIKYLGAPSNSYGDIVSNLLANTLLSFIYYNRRFPRLEEYPSIGKTLYRLLWQAYHH